MVNGSLADTQRRGIRLQFWIAILAAIALSLFFAFSVSNASADTTTSVTVCLQSSTGDPLGGGRVEYSLGVGIVHIGDTDSSGCFTGNVSDDASNIRLNFRGTVVTQPFSTSTTSYTFHTALVTLLNTNRFTYKGNLNNGWQYFATPSNSQELLPGTYTFANWSNLGDQVQIQVSNSGFLGGIVHLRDHNGNGLAGGSVSLYSGGWDMNVGTTDSNGNYVFSVPTSSGLSIGMTYKGMYNQQSLSQLDASNYTFKTTLTTIKLIDADGNGLAGGSALENAYTPLGTTDSSGIITAELLPGNYTFGMSYNGTRQNIAQNIGTNPVVTFETGRVTLYYSEAATYANTQHYTFVKPSMEFLPGTITIEVAGTAGKCQAPLDIMAGDHLVKSAVAATLGDNGTGHLAGGIVSAYVSGHWVQFDATTNGAGVACQLFDGQLGNVAVAMVYNGTRQQITQNQPTDSVYAFKTGNVTIELRNSSNNLIDTGAASYYAAGWHSLGDTSGGKVAVQMLPGSYSFAMTYNGTREQFNHVAVANGSTVTFQTTGVTVYLHRSTGDPQPAVPGGDASYYAAGWHTIGTTGADGTTMVEMLPGKYSFAMVLNGTREQLNGVAISGTTETVDFQTTLVSVLLRTPDGQGAVTDVAASASYYAGGWHTVTTNNGYAPFLMMPGNYSFAMVYKGTREQINNVAVSGATTNVAFLTTQVHSDSDAASSYYAGGWQPFSQNMLLLPGSYWFHFNNGFPQTQETLTEGGTSHID